MAEASGRFFSFPLVSSEDDQLSDDFIKNLLSEAQPSGGEYADFAVHSSPQQMPTLPLPGHSSPQHLQPELPPFSQTARDYREHSSPESIQPLTFDAPVRQQQFNAQAFNQAATSCYGMESFSQPLDITAPMMPYQPFNSAQQARFQQSVQPYDFEVVAENTQHASPQQQDFLQGSLDPGSSGGTLPDLGGLDADGTVGLAMSMRSHREKNRVAQRKFRAKTKQKMVHTTMQLEQLEQQMDALMREKQLLETKNRVLQHTVKLSSSHYSDLQAQRQAYELQQEMIILETSRVYRRGLNRPDLTLDDTKSFTMDSFMAVFQAFMDRYGALLSSGGADPNTVAGRELHEIVSARRLEEARVSLFSQWTSAVLAWNREETRGLQPPTTAFWNNLLASLHLSPEQVREWLAARRRLLEQMVGIRQRREKVALSLGLLLLQKKPTNGSSSEEQSLRESLEEEREAVLDFLYTIIDCNMAPWQEAQCDVAAHPWWPCLWTMCNTLAARSKTREPHDTLKAPEGGAGLFPQYCAAELLQQPMLARGGGLQLKRGIVSVPVPTDVLAAAATPPPTIEKMRNMTVYEVMCGKHLEE